MSRRTSESDEAEQRSRWALRTRALRDPNLSHAAARLFAALDDNVMGERNFSMKQADICALIGLKERQLRSVLKDLRDAHYIRIEHRVTGNSYEFDRQKTAGSERQKIADRTGKKLPVHLIDKNLSQESSPYPASGEFFADAQRPPNSRAAGTNPRAMGTNPRALAAALDIASGACRSCRGSGKVLIQAIGWSDCSPCRGTGKAVRVGVERIA